ncbi:MAG: DUF1648 domain-containing protein [candidate division KSB1 bacterium]|nr:DUF1648 domain-containing protein [candidate division KSB1 bacterium]MDZ7274754.1 DUF1648 domain-containing protein [candidate division KSB1 bacterium]MDZ7285579.1 DUF1648 domain-containing protein [candidate division KSB1 bacterium]MDZ7298611.1 DUF1648 domain-containing protein [candidate division KSB1 bacterium]MDZ7349475.1 DUF1648 domain-containing protein [candidate division KSB1 bacterium]
MAAMKTAVSRPAERPVLALSPSRFEIFLRFTTALGMLTFVYLLMKHFPTLPDRIPVHFNAAGEVDGWGSKSHLLVLFGLIVALTLLLTILRRFPHKFNYLYPITPQNAEKQYRLACELLALLQTEVVWLFTYVGWRMIIPAQQDAGRLSILFLPVIIVINVGTLIFYFVRSSRAR